MAGAIAKQTLLELAKSRFGDDISLAEKELFEAAANGRNANCTGLPEKDRMIRGQLFSWVCTDAVAAKEVNYRGVSISGAEINGQVNIGWAKVSFPIQATNCVFKDEIDLIHGHFCFLSLSGSRTKGLAAHSAVFEDSVFLRNGFKAEGEVEFIGAAIGGDLDCDKGEFIGNGKK
jgi:hypothetical protein